jgi:hypothetical protein
MVRKMVSFWDVLRDFMVRKMVILPLKIGFIDDLTQKNDELLEFNQPKWILIGT